MADTAMDRCEVKRLFKVNGAKEARWVDVAVNQIAADSEAQLRCAYCHGAIKLDKGGDYVMHRWRTDGDNCQGGRGPRGSQGLSSKPVN
jgi:hypothetical protein